MTKREFEKVIREARKDAMGDGMDMHEVAFDMADNMLYDKEFYCRAVIEFNTTNRNLLKECIADRLA